MSIAPYAKSLIAAAVAGLASLQQALDGDNHVTQSEWLAVVVATLVALGAVFYIPNKTPAPDEGGQANVDLLLLVAIFVGVVLLLFGVNFR